MTNEPLQTDPGVALADRLVERLQNSKRIISIMRSLARLTS